MSDLQNEFLDYDDEYDEPVQVFYDISLSRAQFIGLILTVLALMVGVFWGGYHLGQSGQQTDLRLAQMEDEQGRVISAPSDPPLVVENDGSLRGFGEDVDESSEGESSRSGEASSSEVAERIPEEIEVEAAPEAIIEEDEAEIVPVEPKPIKGPYNTVDAPSSWVVQVMATPVEIEARQLEQKLRNGGYPVFVTAIRKDGKNFFRVRVGAFEGRVEANRIAGELRQKYGLGTWIIK